MWNTGTPAWRASVWSLRAFEDGVVDARERQAALGVFELGIDDDQRGLLERARMQRRAGDLEQGFGG